MLLSVAVFGFILDGYLRFKKAYTYNMQLNESEMKIWIVAYFLYLVALILYDCTCLTTGQESYKQYIKGTVLILNFAASVALYIVLRKHEKTLMDMIKLRQSIGAVLVID